jgi:hypothetical protein
VPIVSAVHQRRRSTITWTAIAMGSAGAFALAAIVLGQPSPDHREAAAKRVLVYGHSVRGRPLRAVALGDPRAPRRVLVVGCIHGNECAGRAITRRLAQLAAPAGVALWLVDDANPDGSTAGTRQNARGVDLNRNFPYRWRAMDHPDGVHWSGAAALSEPEARAARTLILRVRPTLTIWYHQQLALVDLPLREQAAARRYARLVGLPPRHLPSYPGSATTWENHYLAPGAAFVVELPAGRLGPAAVARHVAAVQALAGGRPAAPAKAAAPSLRPPILQRRIPFGALRRAEMAAYAQRHYGKRTWRLVEPRVIVEHYTVTATANAAYEVFAPDRRDPELHELPGTCAHFVVARDGTIAQLVDLGTMCRHALGLNYTAIGIEHVGFSDREVMGNSRQLGASLRLTRWLRCRYGIAVRDVIGHAEALSSPYHLERVARLRNQTHGDFARPAMTRYRARLAGLGCR